MNESELNLKEKNQNLERELVVLRAELTIYRYLVYIPSRLIFRFFFGERMSKSVESIKEEVTANFDDLKEGRFRSVAARTIDSSPQKVVNLVESYFIWHFRRRALWGLVALIPTVLLLQQNCLITRQTELLKTQNELFSRQTDWIGQQTRLLERQNESLEKQNTSIDEQTSLFAVQNKSLEKQNDWIGQQTNLLSEQTVAAKTQTLSSQEQIKLFKEQNSFLKTQTGFLEAQTDWAEKQTKSAQAQTDLATLQTEDILLEKVIDDLRNRDPDAPYIYTVADSVKKIGGVRRLSHIQKIRDIVVVGRKNEAEIENILSRVTTRDGDDMVPINELRKDAVSTLLDSQDTYLTILLLINALKEEQARLPRIESDIYFMDFSMVNFEGADLSNITFKNCKLPESIARASKPPKSIIKDMPE